MFAVLPKKPVKQDRFIVRVDKSRMKSKSDETTAKPKEEVESKEILNTTTATSTNNTPSKYFLTNNGMIQPAANTFSTENDKQEEPKKEIKKLKIRLSIIRDAPLNTFPEKKLKKSKETKIKQKKPTREGNINCGRWTLEEHQRFIEAIMKYGNEWKMVQKHVGTRSSTQARSHAQKFFVKIKKTNVIDTNIDLSKNSIKTLHELASSMNLDEYSNAVKALNCVAFEKKALNKRRKRQSSDSVSNDIINFK
jgi:SHAQKYF class myb-like DNA-binding protein